MFDSHGCNLVDHESYGMLTVTGRAVSSRISLVTPSRMNTARQFRREQQCIDDGHFSLLMLQILILATMAISLKLVGKYRIDHRA